MQVDKQFLSDIVLLSHQLRDPYELMHCLGSVNNFWSGHPFVLNPATNITTNKQKYSDHMSLETLKVE